MLTPEISPKDERQVATRPWLVRANSSGAGANAGVRSVVAAALHDWMPILLLFSLDVLSWLAIYATTCRVRGERYYTTNVEFLVVGVLQVLVITQALFIVGGYDRRRDMRTLAYTAEHFLAIIAAAAISAFLIYSAAAFDQAMKPSRGALLVSFLAFLPLSLAYRRGVSRATAASASRKAFLVIGAGENASAFYRDYKKSGGHHRLEFVDIEKSRVGQPIAGLGSPIIEADLLTKLSNLDPSYRGVILAERTDALKPALLEQLVRVQFQSTRVFTIESFYEEHWRYLPVPSIDPFWPLQTGFQLSRTSPYHYLKRLFDLAVAAVLLSVTSPLFAAIVLLIWAKDGRPAIFRQTRIGRDNQRFTVLKFRTMHARKEEAEDDIYTRLGDPRVTRLGHWLRKLRLDELPQLWNVLRGDMSLIGPRAEWDRCAERYEKKIPFYHFRHLVKPGITGWAQVNYPYGESDEDTLEKLKYDLYYIRHYSLTLDAMIVLKTVHTMLSSRGR